MALWTWNPSDKGVGITLSGGNLTLQINSTADLYSVRATDPIPTGTGKWYWEITAASSNPYLAWAGIADTGVPTNNFSGSHSGYDLMWGVGGAADDKKFPTSAGTLPYNTSASVWSGASSPTTSGDVLMIAFDAAGGNLWMGKNGTWFNTSGTANPATGVDPHQTGISTVTTFYPLAGGYNDTSVKLTANFGSAAFSFAAPSGFSALAPLAVAVSGIAWSERFEEFKGRKAFTNAPAFDPRVIPAVGVSGVAWTQPLDYTRPRKGSTDPVALDPQRTVAVGISGVAWTQPLDYARPIRAQTIAQAMPPQGAAFLSAAPLGFWAQPSYLRRPHLYAFTDPPGATLAPIWVVAPPVEFTGTRRPLYRRGASYWKG